MANGAGLPKGLRLQIVAEERMLLMILGSRGRNAKIRTAPVY